MTSWLNKGDRIHIGSDLGEEAMNGGGLAKAVDDTQGIEVGETGRSAIMKFAFCLRLLVFVYRYTDTFYEVI
jgi:hypothetical protein